MKKILPAFILILVIAVGGSFYGGMQYGKNTKKNGSGFGNLSAEERQQRMAQFGAGSGMGGGGKFVNGAVPGGGFINGEIVSKDDKSLTVKSNNSGSKIILFSTSTKVMKSSDGLISDVSIGDNIMINGTSNDDGSISAQSIQLRPPLVPEKLDK